MTLDLKGTHPMISISLSENALSLDSDEALQQSNSLLGTYYMPSFNFEMRWEEVLALGSIEQHERTLQRYKDLVNARRTILGTKSSYTLGIMAACGWAAFYLQQDIEMAFSLFHEIAATLKIIHGPGHPAYLTSLSAVAWSFVCQGKDKEGVDRFGELIPKLKEILGPRNVATLSCEYGLGVALCNLGEPAAGAKILESTLAQQRSLFGDGHTTTLLTMSGLAWAYVGLRRLEEAQTLYEAASEKQTSFLGADHIETMSSTSGRAWLLHFRGSSDAALPIFEDVVVRQARLLGMHHSDTHDSVWGLEKVYKQLGQKSKARELRSLHTSCGWNERNPTRKVRLAGV
jgi:eukaryotic-like serine/threonine-protein kinase